MSKNDNLIRAKKAKNDEFYTRYEDIDKELKNYNLDGMWVYCPCDDYRWSNFVKYFKDNFQSLKLSHLTATNYDIGEGAWRYDYNGIEEKITPLEGNGDFRSKECVELLKEADVVVSNPPFSLFREYVAQLMEYNKKFLILGNMNAITYKEIFPLIKENKLWWGCSTSGSARNMWFECPSEYVAEIKNANYKEECGKKYRQVQGIKWYTNIDHNKRHQPLDLYKKYSAEEYPMYDNYLGFECSKVADIPIDEFIEIEIDENDYPKWKEAYGDDVEIIEG